MSDIPEPPRLDAKLPSHPAKVKSTSDSAGYGKSMIASSAVSSFVTPIIVLCLGGYWLDKQMKHVTPWFSMAGVVLGMALGIVSLLRVLDKLSK